MQSNQQEIEPVLEAISRAALDRGAWVDVQKQLVGMLSSLDSHMISMDLKYRENMWQSILYDKDAEEEFPKVVEHCEVLDYLAEKSDWKFFCDFDFTDEAGIDRSEFYNYSMRHYVRYRFGVRLVNEPDRDTFICFLRTAKQGHVQDVDLDRLRIIAPHLRLAAHVNNVLGTSTHHFTQVINSLEATGVPALIVDGNGVISFANEGAQTLFRRRDGIGCAGGHLKPDTMDGAVKLNQLIAAAANTSLHGSIDAVGGRMAVPRPSGLPSYRVLVSPLPPSEPFFQPKQPWVLVLITDPLQLGDPPAELLQNAYGLTAAEADVAVQFSRGLPLSEIADIRDVSLGTMRNQLKSIQNKTGNTRQAELMRFLLMMTGRDNK